jgi:hypothetical protein
LLAGFGVSGMEQHTRLASHSDPIYCGFCGALVIAGEEPRVRPCPHTIAVATPEGFEYLSDAAAAQLRDIGYTVTFGTRWAGSVDVAYHDEDSERRDRPWVDIIDDLRFPDAINVHAPVPAPSAMEVAVAVAYAK